MQVDQRRASDALVAFTCSAENLKAVLKKSAPKSLKWQVDAFPNETHGTVFHPAALKGLRWAYAPPPAPAK